MEFKEFNKKLRQEGSKIPEGLDWSSMESGIKEKMEKPKRKRYPFFYFLIGFILLTQVGVIGYLMLDNKNNELTIIEENIPAIKKETTVVENESPISSKVIEKKITSQSPISTKKKNTSNNIISRTRNTNTPQSNRIPSPTIKPFDVLVLEDKTDDKNTFFSKNITKKNKTITTHSTDKIGNQKIEELKPISKKEQIVSNEIIVEKNATEIQLSNIESKVGLLLEMTPTYNFIFSKIKQTNYKKEFYVSGGTTYNSWNANSSLEATTRNDAETPLISHQFNLDYKYFFPKNYFIKTGVTFHKNEYLFDYTGLSTRDTLLEQVHLRNQIDTIQNTTTQVFGDTTVVASVVREVKNYNSISSINVPFYLGKRILLNRLFFELEGGLLLNLSTTAEGKTINSDFEIISITDNIVYKKNLGFAIGGQFNIGYAITNGLSIKAGINAHQFISDKSEIETIKFKPKSFGIISGIGFRF